MTDSAEKMRDDQIKHMVDRFLMWKLPSGFSPDCGISFKPDFNEHTAYPMRHEPVGTNLFDAQQATEMVRYMLDGLPTALSADGGGESRPATSKQRIKTTTVHEERTTSVAAAGDKAGVAPGPSDSIPSRPDELEAIARVVKQVAFGGLATDEPSPLCYRVATAILAMQAERRGAKQDIVDLAKDLVALWTSPKISGLPRSERNAAIEDTRNAMIEAVGNLARSSVGSEQGSSNSEVTGSSPVAPATNAAVAQSAEQPFCKGTVSGSSPDGGTNTQPAPIAGLEPVAWQLRYSDSNDPWVIAEKVNTTSLIEWRGLVPVEQAQAHAAEQVRPLVEALEGLIEAVELDADEGLEGIGSYTGARLTDAKNAIRARGQV